MGRYKFHYVIQHIPFTKLSCSILLADLGLACLPALEEGYVEYGAVVVDELEEEHLEGVAILVFCVCSVGL